MKLSSLVLPAGYLPGFDVGRDQGTINVPALQASGVAFLYVRLSDGLHDVDPQAQRTARACLDAGLPFGFYGVLEPYGADHAEAQARHFLEAMGSDSGTTLPPACDLELGKGRTALDLLESACRWCECVGQASRLPFLYAGPAFLRGLVAMAGPAAAPVVVRLIASIAGLWLADYGRSSSDPAHNLTRGWPKSPPGFPEAVLWQVSGDGGIELPGGHGAVDLDLFRGTVEELVGLDFDARATLPSGAPEVDAEQG